jgi:hypothetical protein
MINKVLFCLFELKVSVSKPRHRILLKNENQLPFEIHIETQPAETFSLNNETSFSNNLTLFPLAYNCLYFNILERIFISLLNKIPFLTFIQSYSIIIDNAAAREGFNYLAI